MSSVPVEFYSKLKSVYNSAKESGSLVFSESTTEYKASNSFPYVITVVPHLKKKPSSELTSSENLEKEFNPFNPPDPSLVVLSDYSSNYAVVLNKFPIIPNHFLMITHIPFSQSLPLPPDDLLAAFELLRAANSQSGQRHLGFFNCGPSSGASVNHRHIQFLTVPTESQYRPFPDLIRDHQSMTADVKFEHIVVRLSDEVTLDAAYAKILARLLTVFKNLRMEGLQCDKSYNFIFTEEWAVGIPRSNKASDSGIGINGVGVVGMMLAKGADEVQKIDGHAEDIILDVGYPKSELQEGEYDY